MRSGNPSLNSSTFDKHRNLSNDNPMTLQGTVNKVFILLFLLIFSSIIVWNIHGNGFDVIPIVIGGAILGFIIALVTIFNKKISPITAPIYAILEGLFVGGISAIYESEFQGITIQAVLITFGVLFALLLAYSSRLIKPSENFKLGIVAATGGIFLVYLFDIILSFFGMNVPFIHESSPVGILVSVVIVIIASLNLILDFDFIEEGCKSNVPKYMEWYTAFGLIVTLVWLYLEILRLLSKIYRR